MHSIDRLVAILESNYWSVVNFNTRKFIWDAHYTQWGVQKYMDSKLSLLRKETVFSFEPPAGPKKMKFAEIDAAHGMLEVAT